MEENIKKEVNIRFKSEKIQHGKNRRCQLTVSLDDFGHVGVPKFRIRVLKERLVDGQWVVVSYDIDEDFIKCQFKSLLPYLPMNDRCFDGLPLNGITLLCSYYKTGRIEDIEKMLLCDWEAVSDLACLSERPKDLASMLIYRDILTNLKEKANELIKLIGDLNGENYDLTFSCTSDYHILYAEHNMTEFEEKLKNGTFNLSDIKSNFESMEEVRKKRTLNTIIKNFEEEKRNEEIKRDVLLSLVNAGIPHENIIIYSHTNECSFNFSYSSPLIPNYMVENYIDNIGKVMFPYLKFTNKGRGV